MLPMKALLAIRAEHGVCCSKSKYWLLQALFPWLWKTGVVLPVKALLAIRAEHGLYCSKSK